MLVNITWKVIVYLHEVFELTGFSADRASKCLRL